MNKSSQGIAVLLPVILTFAVLLLIVYLVSSSSQKPPIEINTSSDQTSTSEAKSIIKADCPTDPSSTDQWKSYKFISDFTYTIKYPQCFSLDVGSCPSCNGKPNDLYLYYPISYHGRYYTKYYEDEEFKLYLGSYDNENELPINEWYDWFKSIGNSETVNSIGIQIVDEPTQLKGVLVSEKEIQVGSDPTKTGIQAQMRYEGREKDVDVVYTFAPVTKNKVLYFELYSATDFGIKMQNTIFSTIDF